MGKDILFSTGRRKGKSGHASLFVDAFTFTSLQNCLKILGSQQKFHHAKVHFLRWICLPKSAYILMRYKFLHSQNFEITASNALRLEVPLRIQMRRIILTIKHAQNAWKVYKSRTVNIYLIVRHKKLRDCYVY
ncbi:hypothetical protein AVEN_34885-1 [Araneus ventricosus]|uniref:Uncharacterized protein n=1 Tax=Araneus ventricosus TaxID=182803 RepID=A0A4Y2SEA7_ARAVE|nr:hypothetical protein AVEN_34885-1 [Araneus ventricosus]